MAKREAANIVETAEAPPNPFVTTAAKRFRVSANPPTPLVVRVWEGAADNETQAVQQFFALNGIPAGGQIAGVIDVVEL